MRKLIKIGGSVKKAAAAIILLSATAWADVLWPGFVIDLPPFASFKTDLPAYSMLCAIVWAFNFFIDFALAYFFLRLFFRFDSLRETVAASFIGSLGGYAMDYAAWIFSAAAFSHEEQAMKYEVGERVFYATATHVNGWAYFLLSLALLFCLYFILAKFYLKLDSKADEIAAYYAALEEKEKKPPRKKPKGIAGYSLAWESAKPAAFALLMAFFTNPFWVRMLLNL